MINAIHSQERYVIDVYKYAILTGTKRSPKHDAIHTADIMGVDDINHPEFDRDIELYQAFFSECAIKAAIELW